MELPSMVQRSGDTLIVRSVVSGNQLYMDQNTTGPETTNMNTSNNNSNNNNSINSNNNNNNNNVNSGNGMAVSVGGINIPNSAALLSNSSIMQQIERLKRSQEAAAAQQHLMQQQHHQMQQQQQQQLQHHQQNIALELKEEGLPQCKIKRNYSCSYCTYFTQNPRCHLTHLRDVHGEKIVINKCKLCLYASRHYQKLVRHMKMVHNCTDGVSSGHGQARGKRGMNRDRKRKLEDTLAVPAAMKLMNVEGFNAEQIQADLEQKIHRDLDLFKQQQQQQQQLDDQQQKSHQQQQQQQQLSVSAAGALFAAAYEQQLRAQRELADKDALKTAHSNYERRESSPPAALTADDVDASTQQKTYDYTPSPQQQQQQQQEPKIQIPPQRPSFELTPSPSGSNSSPPPAGQSTSGSTTPLSGVMPSDEPSNNRLMKCSLCDFTTLYRNNLLEHEIEDHCNAKFYRCEKCSYVTHIKARFSKHVKYHSMPMIKCVTCDFRTPYKWNLDRHMKNHGGAGPFRCAACDFTADIKQSLTVHEMNHHVPPVGHAAGMTLARRRNKVGGTDISEDFFSDSAEMLEDHFNNNNMDEYDEMLMTAGPVEGGMYETKRLRYEEDEPTDLSQKGGSSDTSSVHNHTLPKVKKPLPNLIPISKEGQNILNLTTDLAASRSSLSEIASIFFNEKQISEMLQPLDKADAAAGAASQLSPTTTINSSSAASSKSLLARKAGSFFDKIKSSTNTNENLICPCGHMAKCLSESIIHRKSCNFLPLSVNEDIDLDDEDHDEDDGEEGRLEIDFTEDDDCDKQSHSALNLSVTGSTRCQHCRHRCKSSADLLNHLKICSEANSRCGDSVSGESCTGSRIIMGSSGGDGDGAGGGDNHHPMENRVFVWNKLPRNQEGSQNFEGNRQLMQQGQSSSHTGGSSLLSSNNDENSYYGVETAPGYGEMTPEEEAANSSLKKVYKCPHCSFWASTASRFHVHIVGHLNKKPFECSLCSYRSNWRWDITKHIRLKTIRDPSHKNARVLMNDETGRRNYTKYNKYITLMKVTEEDGDPKLMKSGEMTPNQVASLAFINDYNSKQQQGSISSSGSTPIANILNGVREDITLEPIPSKSAMGAGGGGGDEGMSDNFIRLPLLASMMNAAIAQQQHQKNHSSNDHETATMITPSVTISAVKKNPHPSQSFKPSDEIILEVRPDSNEKNYKCRKCSFRHMNRDAVLAHVKVHFPDPNMPIVTATATTSPKAAHNSPLQVSVNNSNSYMNKVLAAMCLSQQQPANSANAQLSNLVAAGLLDQAAGNSPLSGLALALAGKSPLKASQFNAAAAAAAAANIIEHGEQKAILNDQASAENTMTSPNQLTLVRALQHNPQQQQQPQQATSASSLSGYGASTSKHSSSLQNLLTSPRGNPNDGGVCLTEGTMVMGSSYQKTATTTTLTNKPGLMAATSAPPQPTTTTTTTTPSPTTIRHCRLKHAGVINIETLDRAATGDRHAAPIYKPLVNGALSEQQTQSLSGSNNNQYSLTLKALQQQQQNHNNNMNNNNNNNTNVLMDNNNQTAAAAAAKLSISLPKSETAVHSLLHSPLALASGPSQDLQAAAVAYLAAAYKAAAAQNSSNPNATAAATMASITSMAEELLLQQQLQKNDQIEITRVSSSSSSANSNNLQNLNLLKAAANNTTAVNNSNLAQLLESQSLNHAASGGGHVTNASSSNNNQNAKSKQQKCPLCPYICDSKSQMNYHISLHKPTQYECHLCTFVCAKKQHLSSHLRTVHQLLPQQQQQALAGTNSLSMDFSLALKMAAAAKSQQDPPLAIDLSGIKHIASSVSSPAQQRSNTVAASTSAQHQTQQLPPEYQYRSIFYCNKCPARYAQKHSDPQTAKIDLDDHLRQHEPLMTSSSSSSSTSGNPLEDNRKYQCEYCDYRAAHESLIQAHRNVHTTQYQEKCNELYKNCKDDPVFRAPKLMHITATRKQHHHQQHHETIWVVDQDLNENPTQPTGHHMVTKLGGQNSAITSSSQGQAFEGGNSLLKKQLESKQSPPVAVGAANAEDSESKKILPEADESNPSASTTASGATSEPEADHHAMDKSPHDNADQEDEAAAEAKERCQHCPFESSHATEFKTHIQQHIAVSQQRLAYTCEHCDYTAEEQEQIEEHTRVHFNSMEKLKEVAFFTSYDKLELSMEQPLDEGDDDADADAGQQPHETEEEGVNMNIIKKEVQSNNGNHNNNNNNNDEDRVNENFKQSNDEAPGQSPVENSEQQPPQKCAKIILYKNDGCLTIKKETQESQQTANSSSSSTSSSSNNNSNNNNNNNNNPASSQNISDRLRRRISRQGGATAATATTTTTATAAQTPNQNPDDQQSTRHKTILVNAKTGQVISRN